MKTRRIILANLFFPLVFLAFVGCTPSTGTRNVPAAETATGETGNSTAIPTWTSFPQIAFTPTTTGTSTPAFTSTPTLSAITIVVGRRHTCVLTVGQRVKCWGENEDGQLGDGTTIRKSAAVDVSGLDEDVGDIAAGYNHTCAITMGHGMKCWGNNAFGQLGDGTQTSRNTPVGVLLPDNVVAISAGGYHTCATTGRDVYCWGIVDYKFMDGEDVITITFKPYPVDLGMIPSDDFVLSVAAGFDHDCLLTGGGAVYCWGRNDMGQLGQGSLTYGDSVPRLVNGLNGGVKQLAAGGSHTCAITKDSTVKCWGYNNAGQLGRKNPEESGEPLEVAGVRDAFSLSAGAYHTCAVVMGGRAKCWGDNRFGQLGGESPATGNVVDVTGAPGNLRWIAAGGSHTCALTESGNVSCWGSNKYGQLGNRSFLPTPAPTRTEAEGTEPVTPIPSKTPPISSGATSIAAGHSHSCAVTGSGGVKCWGNNEHGELGNGTWNSSPVPVDVAGLKNGVRSVVAGWGHTCALTDSGGVKCWGYNQNGELGNGANANSSTPVNVRGLAGGVKSLEAGDDHTCAVMEEGGVKCWGFNEYGQVGDGTAVNRNTPVDVQGIIPQVVMIAAGWGHTCALTSQGSVKCWGNNHYGQVGDGSSIENLHTPVNVAGLAYGVTAISADGGHTCALMEKGLVMCWGNNKYGQLGDGTAEVREVPVPVVGLTTGIAKVVAGWNNTCVVKTSGDLVCWGWNYYGQLGNGIRTTSTRPVDAGELVYGVTALAIGWGHACAITDAGGVQCWGLNDRGQVGDGSTSDAFLPVDVVGLKGRS